MHAISLYFMFYNFCKVHKTLRVISAIEAGISKMLWEISDVVMLIPDEAPKKRGSFKKNVSSRTSTNFLFTLAVFVCCVLRVPYLGGDATNSYRRNGRNAESDMVLTIKIGLVM